MTTPATTAEADPHRVAEPRGLGGRLADRLNPVLVREVQQALNSRAFVAVLTLALASVVLVALAAVAESEGNERAGATVLTTTLAVLVPLLFVVVPLQAFLATRQEVASGTVEHLLLSRLTPGAVVRGKLLAATVQFVLYLAVFAPLIALTYQLRGVDVVTLASLLLLTFLVGIAACGYGVAGGACCRVPQLQALSFLAVVGGLVVLTIVFLGGVSFAALMRRGGFGFSESPFGLVLRLSLLVVTGLWLFSLVGASTLAHPYENRSSGFRAFATLFVLAFPAWVVWMEMGPSATLRPAAPYADDLSEVVAVLAVATLPFWLFAVTEEQALSPRVRIAVPRHPALALLVAPFLPGSGRGFVFAILLGGVAVLGAHVVPPVVFGVEADDTDVAALAWAYVGVYAGIGAFVRRRLRPGPGRNWVARGIVLVVLVAAILVPVVADVALAGQVRAWHAGHALSPFVSLDEAPRDDLAVTLLVLLAVSCAGNARAAAAGVREVLAASADRRRARAA